MQLQGATVLVTGGSRGIGEAMARAFAASGSKVVVAARSLDDINRVAREVRGIAVPVDLLDRSQVDSLIDRVEEEAGPIDVLVNNAGLDTVEPFASVSDERIRDVLNLNLEVPLVLTRHVLPGMLKRDRGHIVMLSSLAGSAGFPGLAAYSATKAGLNNFLGALRLELGDSSVKTTLVAPGPVDTAMWSHLEDGDYFTPMLKRLRLMQLIPMYKPEQIAAMTVKAVAENRRHVRTPKRLSATFWLGEAPRRITETILTGVHFDKPRNG